MSKTLSYVEPHLSDNTWLTDELTEADARRLVIAELGGIWTETRVDGAALLANVLVHAWNAGDLTEREAEALLRYAAGSGPEPRWLAADLANWKREFLAS